MLPASLLLLLVPVPREAPPEELASQLMVAPPAVAERVPEPGPQEAAPVVTGAAPTIVTWCGADTAVPHALVTDTV